MSSKKRLYAIYNKSNARRRSVAHEPISEQNKNEI